MLTVGRTSEFSYNTKQWPKIVTYNISFYKMSTTNPQPEHDFPTTAQKATMFPQRTVIALNTYYIIIMATLQILFMNSVVLPTSCIGIKLFGYTLIPKFCITPSSLFLTHKVPSGTKRRYVYGLCSYLNSGLSALVHVLYPSNTKPFALLSCC